jgi:hypothetical protein
MHIKYSIALGGILLALQLQAQQELMLSSLSDLWHTNSLNPALFPEGKRIAIGLPAFSIDVAHSGNLTYNDFFRQEGDRTILDLGKALNKLEPENEVNFDQRIETVSLGMRSRNGQWALQISHAIQLTGFARYPKSLAEILWNGNAPYVGQTLQIGPQADIFNWQEWGVGVSRRISSNFIFGARAKFLTGGNMLQTDETNNTIEVYTDPDIYQLKLRTDYGFVSSGIVTAVDTSGLGFDIETGSLRSKPDFANNGFALDFGFQAKLSERFSLHVAALNVGGKITWEKNTASFSSRGQYTYQGAEVSGLDIINGSDDLDFDAKLDTLNDIFKFSRSAAVATADLPLRMVAGASFQLSEKWQIGFNGFYQRSDANTHTALGASVRWAPLTWLNLGAMYSANSRSASDIGFHLVLKPGPVQVYFVSDNILNVFAPNSSPAANLRVGGALLF